MEQDEPQGKAWAELDFVPEYLALLHGAQEHAMRQQKSRRPELNPKHERSDAARKRG